MANKATIRRQTADRYARFYRLAAYVTPHVALDVGHAAALQKCMKRDGIGVSDAIRSAILAYAAPASASRPAARQARPVGSRRAAPARRAPTN